MARNFLMAVNVSANILELSGTAEAVPSQVSQKIPSAVPSHRLGSTHCNDTPSVAVLYDVRQRLLSRKATHLVADQFKGPSLRRQGVACEMGSDQQAGGIP